MQVRKTKKNIVLFFSFLMLVSTFGIAVKVDAKPNPNFDALYAGLCKKGNHSGITGYICNIRKQNKDLSLEVQDLKNQVQQLQTNVPSEITLFSEQFDGSQLNLSKWDVHDNGGTVVVDKGELTLDTSTTAVRAPFLQIKNPPYFNTPADPSHISFEWKMRYNRAGAGLGLIFTTDNVDPNSLGNINVSPYVFGTWTNGLLFNHDGTHFFASIPTDNNFHTYKVTYHGFYFYYYLDGMLKETARTFSPYDVKSLFIGTSNEGSRADWSSISVDYIKVTAPSFVPSL